jgi:UPF0271 protein
VRYVKPHGALYNAVVHNAEQAAAVVAGAQDFDVAVPVLGLPGSELLTAVASAGLPIFEEAFADRAYTAEGRLVSRRQPGAVIHEPEQAVRRCLRMATEGAVDSIEGTPVSVAPASLCVHGDTAGAVEVAGRIRNALVDAGVELKAFA